MSLKVQRTFSRIESRGLCVGSAQDSITDFAKKKLIMSAEKSTIIFEFSDPNDPFSESFKKLTNFSFLPQSLCRP